MIWKCHTISHQLVTRVSVRNIRQLSHSQSGNMLIQSINNTEHLQQMCNLGRTSFQQGVSFFSFTERKLNCVFFVFLI